MTPADFLDLLHRQRVLPVLRLDSGEAAVAAATALLGSGLSMVELTATTPEWPEALRQVGATAQASAGSVVGLGTVTDATIAEKALAAGAQFLVSPWSAPEVRAVAADAGVPFLEGAFTPGEVATAAALGPVKLFPAAVGGPGLLRSVRDVLPDAVIVPTGGIALADVPTWLSAGAHAVGVGSDLLRPGAAEQLARLLELLR